MKSILILGGTSYVGKRLVNQLLQRGYFITVASRQSLQSTDTKIKKVVIDRRSRESMITVLGQYTFDVVYDQLCFNQDDARFVCDIFSKKIGRYIFSSSQAVYPAGNNWQEATFGPESNNHYTIDPVNFSYAADKRAAEEYLYHHADFPTVAVRFPIILGQDDPRCRLQHAIAKAYKTRVIWLENLSAKISLMHSSDASNFLLWLLDAVRINGPINACSTQPIKLIEIVNLIQDCLRIPIAVNHFQHVNARYKFQVHTGWEEYSQLFPLSISEDWTMDTAYATSQGYIFESIDDWLPKLIRNSVNILTS